jgi:hypothetical protein
MATAHLRHQIGRGDGRHSGYNLLNGAASALALESGSGCSMGFLSSVGEVGSGERGRNTEDRIGEAAHPGRVQLGIGSEFDLTSTPSGRFYRGSWAKARAMRRSPASMPHKGASLTQTPGTILVLE